MTVLDASAVLALLGDEPGGAVVEAALAGARLSTVNLAEVLAKIVDTDGDPRQIMRGLIAADVAIVPLTAEDAAFAAALRSIDGGRSLSLGDRCCLALTARSNPPLVLTGDRLWAELDLPVDVELIR